MCETTDAKLQPCGAGLGSKAGRKYGTNPYTLGWRAGKCCLSVCLSVLLTGNRSAQSGFALARRVLPSGKVWQKEMRLRTLLSPNIPRHPKGRGSDAVCCFFFLFFVFFVCLCKKKRNCKGEIAKSKLTHCRCIKHLKRRAPTVACSFADAHEKLTHGSDENREFF